MTGTPLQNNVEELFGLLNFLEPERFSCVTTFISEYGDLRTEQQVEDLKAVLKPMMLRRLKEDVEKSLAPKEETIVEVSDCLVKATSLMIVYDPYHPFHISLSLMSAKNSHRLSVVNDDPFY